MESTSDANDPALRFYRLRVAEAQALNAAQRFEPARKAFAGLLADPRFDALDPAERRALLSANAWSHVRSGELEDAARMYRRADAIGLNDPDDLYRLALIEFDLQRHDGSAEAMSRFVEYHPELLPQVSPDFLFQLVRAIEPASDIRLGLMQALFDANWRTPAQDESAIWYALALRRVIRGEPELAVGPLRRVNDPSSLVLLRSDRRFDRMIDRASWQYDVAAAAERRIETLRKDADARPTNLDARIQLGYALLAANQAEALLALADETMDRIATSPPGTAAFDDMEQQAWLLDHRARALRRLGRHEEALAELRRGSDLRENGDANVSQVLNLGAALCAMHRPREALDAIAGVGDMSGYGRTVQAGVRHCAAMQLGDAATAARELAYLREHRDVSQVNFIETLLHEKRMDEAARALVEVLADEDKRLELLSWMQGYDDRHPFPRDVALLELKAELLARQDVQAAVAPIGRIERQPIDGLVVTL
jgi:tetratricopeptide (TPR) repeat protein